MPVPLKPSAQKVQQILREKGFSHQVIEFPESTRTAAEAAQAVGCEVGQIVKSLIFKTRNTARPVLVIASGSNRVDVKKVRRLIGEKLGKADADFVRMHTGFAIGGVPPLGHVSQIDTFIDEDLLQYDEIWAAAGTPFAVFKLTPNELLTMTGGTVADIRETRNVPKRK